MAYLTMAYCGFVAVFLLSFIEANVSVVLRGTDQDPGASIIAALRHAAKLKNRTIDPTRNLLCNCSRAGCGNEVANLLGPERSAMCLTNTTCIKKVLSNNETELSCQSAFSESCFVKDRTKMLVGSQCCSNQSFCNAELDIFATAEGEQENGIWYQILIIVGIGVFVISIFVGMLLAIALFKRPDHGCSFKIFKQLFQKSQLSTNESEELITSSVSSPTSQIVDKMAASFTDTCASDSTKLDGLSSGSGSGLPGLMQRTVARQIDLLHIIGDGRFGQVWLGKWRGEAIAVKLFSPRDMQSYDREVEIYETNWLRHPNILAYIASDSRDVGSELQLWLITEYHENGSLFDYLKESIVTTPTATKMIRSIASGLSFLHFEVANSLRKKPPIAHRDIKSKNILVKSDLSCTIADFGLAVRFIDGQVDIPINGKCGTTRYLSPELLSDNYNARDFEAHKMSDIYAFGLVMWEILRRCETDGLVSSFEVPYFDYTPREPSIEDMKRCVAVEKHRPAPCEYWKDNVYASKVYGMICECWAECPTNRLTAQNVRTTIDRLTSYYGFNEID